MYINYSLTINGTDFSDVFSYYDSSETIRRVQGRNSGVAINGDEILDIRKTFHDLTLTQKPCSATRLAAAITALINDRITVYYWSGTRNAYVTQYMTLDSAVASLLLVKGGSTGFYGMPITLREVS